MSNIYQILYLQHLQKQKILKIFRGHNNPTNHSTNHSNNHPTNHSNNHPTNHSTNNSIETSENSDLIRQNQYDVIKNLIELKKKNINITPHLNKLKVIRTFSNIHEGSQKVELIEGYIVKKQCQQTSLGYFLFTNEVNTLKKLQGFPHFPHLISFDADKLIIYMTYCGETVSSKNLPTDWQNQMSNILRILSVLNINSNDMSIRNTCCLGDELKIIDFGLNTQFKKSINESIIDLTRQINSLSNSSNNNDNTNQELNYKSYKIYYPNWEIDLKKNEELMKRQIQLQTEYYKKMKPQRK
jgi:tRNA A-37 threonylcarbamoyl transferase component Bud32